MGSASAAAAAGSIRTCSQFRVRRVACGLSGGVDSTVSALLLKRAGFEVVGVFMKNWDVPDEVGDATPACPLDRDAEDAEKVCRQLGIAFKQANFVKEYWQDVFDGLIADYRRGVTPNPDVECNRLEVLMIPLGHGDPILYYKEILVDLHISLTLYFI